MYHALLMTVRNGGADATEKVQTLTGRQLQVVCILRKRLGVGDVLHDEVRNRRIAETVNAHCVDVRYAGMLEAAQKLRLVLESPQDRWRGKPRPHELHGDGAFGLLLLTFVHAAHAALGDQTDDRHASDIAA